MQVDLLQDWGSRPGVFLASLTILGPSYGTPPPGWDAYGMKVKGTRELVRIQILHKVSSQICCNAISIFCWPKKVPRLNPTSAGWGKTFFSSGE